MAYTKIPTGKIVADENGKASIRTKSITGKIIKVRVDYGTTDALTTLRILTIEEEKVVELHENNQSVVLYPRHSVVHERFPQIPVKENEPVMEAFVTVGEMIIEVENAGEGGTIENIIFTLEK